MNEQPNRQNRQPPDIDALFRAHQERLVRAVGATVHTSKEVVEDACSFAWMQLLRTEPEIGETIGAWLRTVAVREAIRLDRLGRRGVSIEDAPSANLIDRRQSTPEQRTAWREQLAEVARLPKRQRDVIAMQAAGLSYEEIAAATGDSRRTVERQLMRAKRQTRR